MNVIINLHSEISGFSITEDQETILRRSFPDWNFFSSDSTETFLEHLKYCQICITWQFRAEWYAEAPQLKAIFTPSAGHDWIERNADYPVPVFFGSFHGPIMAESLLGMILYFNRKFSTLLVNQSRHIWDRDVLSDTNRLGSQTVILIGYGNIARECARVLKVFGCRIIGVKHSPYNSLLDKDADTILHPNHLKEILPECDHIVTILPGTRENDGILSREYFSLMKKGAFFYNIGRANCYKEPDLLWALDEKILAGAGLDVFATEPIPHTSTLWDKPEILIMPHGSALCKEYIPMFIQEMIPKMRVFL